MVLAEAKNEFTLQLKRTFNAQREQVFAAWTEADAVSRWFAPTDEFTTRAAGSMTLETTVTELVAMRTQLSEEIESLKQQMESLSDDLRDLRDSLGS